MLGAISVLITPLLGINASHVLEINGGDTTLRSIDVDALEDTQMQTMIDALDTGANDDITLALVMSPAKFSSPSVTALLLRLRMRGLLRLRINCLVRREAHQHENLSLLPFKNNTIDSKTCERKSRRRRQSKGDDLLLAADTCGAHASQDCRKRPAESRNGSVRCRVIHRPPRKKNEAVPYRNAQRSRLYPSGADFYFRRRRWYQLKIHRRCDLRRSSVQQV
mmetsp:Transcript_23958/g.52127  ORF Transcript_23958/g.52127 Transcript_23958/m.52127 type:complete len:222 (+) Transcript_23958:606-1271(+)